MGSPKSGTLLVPIVGKLGKKNEKNEEERGEEEEEEEEGEEGHTYTCSKLKAHLWILDFGDL